MPTKRHATPVCTYNISISILCMGKVHFMGFREDGGELEHLDGRNIQGYFVKDFLSPGLSSFAMHTSWPSGGQISTAMSFCQHASALLQISSNGANYVC